MAFSVPLLPNPHILEMQTRLSVLEEAVRSRAESVARMSLSKRLRKNK